MFTGRRARVGGGSLPGGGWKCILQPDERSSGAVEMGLSPGLLGPRGAVQLGRPRLYTRLCSKVSDLNRLGQLENLLGGRERKRERRNVQKPTTGADGVKGRYWRPLWEF